MRVGLESQGYKEKRTQEKILGLIHKQGRARDRDREGDRDGCVCAKAGLRFKGKSKACDVIHRCCHR